MAEKVKQEERKLLAGLGKAPSSDPFTDDFDDFTVIEDKPNRKNQQQDNRK